ncbi:hypothetical protein MP228_007933 [Amoeboaphelidium protococcarum]|nr:hypothetical protein MP228_007933 [Amoeboaphelidium protococcarum]
MQSNYWKSVSFALPAGRAIAGKQITSGNRVQGGKINILALHGWLDNASSFDFIAPALIETHTEQNIDLVALDFAGHGQSSHNPPGQDYSLVSHVRDILQVLKSQQWKSVYLLAHSMGGAVASLLSAAYPELIKGCCLIESLGPLTRPVDHTTRGLRQHLQQRLKLLESTDPLLGMPVYRSIEDVTIARQKGTSNGTISLEGARLLTERGIKQLPDGTFTWRTDRVLTTASGMSYDEPQILNIMAGIQCPVFAVYGRQGFAMILDSDATNSRDQSAEDQTDAFSHIDWSARWRVLAKSTGNRLERHLLDGGHHLHMDKDGAVPELAKLISSWLSNCENQFSAISKL